MTKTIHFIILSLGLYAASAAAVAQGLFDLAPHRPVRPASILKNPDHWMAVIGDSGSTGAASNPDLVATATNLLGHALSFGWNSRMTATLPDLANYPNPQRFGIKTVEPMTRVLYSAAELSAAQQNGSVATLNFGAKAALALDTQEHGNGYMIGRGLGIEAQDIVLVGQDGKRFAQIPEQFERIYEMQTTTLPPLVLMSFTANDFCGGDIFDRPLAEIRERFERNLREAWEASARFLKAHPRGTKIVVLPALEVANVLTNRDLLQQTIPFQGMGEVTCQRLRENEEMNGFLTAKTVEALGGSCRAVLRTKPSDAARVQVIRNVQNELNQVWLAQIAKLNERYSGQGIQWLYLEEMRALRWSKGDLGSDCFHPGVRAHAKIADYVLKNVFGK